METDRMAKESPDDENLLERVGKGDRAAFAVLVRRHSDRYYRLAYRYTARHEEAEDIVQVAFIKLWETPDIWDPRRGARFTTWFYRVVVNLCLDSRKKRGEAAVPESLEPKDENPDSESKVAESEARTLLAREIKRLPPRQKTALILCFYEELRHEDAAGIMKVSVSALRSLLMRAKATLRREMDRYL